MTDLIFGTSGWSYKEWVGPFYRDEKRMFSFYTKYFETAEVNSTFYKYPSREMTYGWYRYSPRAFKFSVKMPRLITHKKKLRLKDKVENDLFLFLELLNPLKAGDKLGPILIQLPPSFAFEEDYETLSKFLEILPKEYSFTVEFRNRSWMRMETFELLKRNEVAYTIVDEPLIPPDVYVTADFAYIRWHGRGKKLWYDYRYSKEELELWVPTVQHVANKVKKVYGYFNNHFHAYAVENCVQMLEMLGKATEKQVRIKNEIFDHNLTKKTNVEKKKLDFFWRSN